MLPTALELIGGDPALDFANTLGGARGVDPDEDFLRDYRDLIAWAGYAQVLDEPTAERLAAAARRRPDDADDAFARARRLRWAIFAVFEAGATGKPPAPGPLAELGDFHAQAIGRARLASAGEAFDFVWDGDDLDRVLWPLALSAVDLLRAGPLERVKLCAACRWLFLDLSRNRSRRWCSMSQCGAHDKMRRYRERRRATEGR